MKKLFVIILSVMLLFVSCAKVDDITARIPSQDSEIMFNVGSRVATKAIVEGTAMVDTFGGKNGQDHNLQFLHNKS